MRMRSAVRKGMVPASVALALVLGAALAPAAEARGPDKVPTSKGDLVITPIEHATFALAWGGKTIYVDPVGGAERFKGLPPPDLILLTDIHSDHLDAPTLKAVAKEKTVLVLPKAAVEALGKEKADPVLSKLEKKVLSNGEKAAVLGIPIEAVPMYNTTPDRKKYHEKGRGNGYVLDLAGTKVYISGDTEDIPEMRRLKDIAVAFLCMNLPYTMTAEQAASAVLEFKPKIVYPYHSKGQDLSKLKSLVEEKAKGIEVRLRDWYPKK